MTEPLTAAQIVKMIHPDLPPATAHFLLNEAKPLLEWIEAQAEELAKYKHLATTAIDDAAALRAQLAALQCEDELPELPTMQEVQFSGHREAHSFYDADDMQAYARQAQAMVRVKAVPLTLEQISDAIYKADAQHNIEFMTAEWPVIFTRAIESAHGITGEPK